MNWILPSPIKGGSWRRVTSATLSTICLFRAVWVAISHFQLSVQKRRDLLVVEGRTLTPSSLVSPFPASLPVGFSWSTHFCQDAALRTAAESGIPRCIPVISDRSLPVLLSSDQGETWSHGLRYNLCRQLQSCGQHRSRCD